MLSWVVRAAALVLLGVAIIVLMGQPPANVSESVVTRQVADGFPRPNLPTSTTGTPSVPEPKVPDVVPMPAGQVVDVTKVVSAGHVIVEDANTTGALAESGLEADPSTSDLGLVLLSRVAETYEGIMTYRETCELQVSWQYDNGSIVEDSLVIRTVARSPDRFRMELEPVEVAGDGMSMLPDGLFVVWQDGCDIRTILEGRRLALHHRSLAGAIDLAWRQIWVAGAASPLAQDLVAAGPGRVMEVLSAAGLQFVGRETVADARCWRFKSQTARWGEDLPGMEWSVWIDEESHVIRLASGRDLMMSWSATFDTEINVPIPDEELAFNPPK